VLLIMEQQSLADRINVANLVALQRMATCVPVWVAVAPAGDAIPGMDRRTVLHSGPPIPFHDMCGPQRHAVCGVICWEGLSSSIEEAAALVESDAIRLLPNHELGAVSPMTGVVSASMPVFVVEDRCTGRRSWTAIHEGSSRQRLSFGSLNQAVFENLNWVRDTLAPALDAAVQAVEGLALLPLLARALAMGDECHNRLYATTSMLSRELAPTLVDVVPAHASAVLRFLAKTDNLALNLAMPAFKLMAQAMHGIPFCSLVTAMSRNGSEFGIRVSSLGDTWFTAPANPVEGVYFAGYSAADAGLDMGDSSIAETVGFGGFALAASPSMVSAVGGDAAMARRLDAEMRSICAGTHQDFVLPPLDFRPVPVGIDVRKVVDTGIAPVIDTAIAHRDGGQIGVGLVRAPLSCFTQALRALGSALI